MSEVTIVFRTMWCHKCRKALVTLASGEDFEDRWCLACSFEEARKEQVDRELAELKLRVKNLESLVAMACRGYN